MLYVSIACDGLLVLGLSRHNDWDSDALVDTRGVAFELQIDCSHRRCPASPIQNARKNGDMRARCV